MKTKINFTAGQKIGACIFIKELQPIKLANGKHRRKGRFKCECGKTFTSAISNIQSGNTKTCGCRINGNSGKWIKHGYYVTHPGEFMIWNGMVKRCHDPKSSSFYYYGATGITVCDRWRYSFENFFSDIGPRPSKSHTLDRYPNNKGNYEPGNVRWATNKQQSRNYSRNFLIQYDGRTQCLVEWCEELNLESCVISQRIRRLKWSIEKAFTTPVNQKVNKICDFCGKEFEIQAKNINRQQIIIACSNNCRSAMNRRRRGMPIKTYSKKPHCSK